MTKKNMIIYVDAWCSGNPGLGGWRGVDKNGIELFKKGTKTQITNNIGEWFALIDGIKWSRKAIDEGLTKNVTIYTDSKTALSWLRRKNVKSSLKGLDDVIDKTINYIKDIELEGIKILKHDTKKLGEIPADFGRKKKKRD